MAEFPDGFVELAKIYASHTHALGDRASIVLAQAALETGWFSSKLWREGKNAFGIQAARNPSNREHQTGRPVGLKYGVQHAGYKVVADSFRDRERVIRQHAAQLPELDIWQRFDRLWAPPDPRYPSNLGYSAKLKKIIAEHQLEKFDTQHAPPREDLKPTAPYVPVDPRDATVPGHGPRPSLGRGNPGWLLLVLVFFAGVLLAASPGLPWWAPVAIELVKRALG